MPLFSWLFPLFLSLAAFSHADPWGKDADLAYRKAPLSPSRLEPPTSSDQKCSPPILVQIGETLIRFHQEIISPADGPRSHFIPSSSQYTLDAMRKYGFFHGITLGCDRLMRENNDHWVYRVTRDGSGKLIKYDPVP